MILLPDPLRAALRANARASDAAARGIAPEPDPVPLLRLFNPIGRAEWLASELDADGDTLFGLADLGFGCPELGSFSLSEIGALRLPLGLRIARDPDFTSPVPLSRWAAIARRTGSIRSAASILRRENSPKLPPHGG